MPRRPRTSDPVVAEARRLVRDFGDSAESVLSAMRLDVQGAEGFARFDRLEAEVAKEIEYVFGR